MKTAGIIYNARVPEALNLGNAIFDHLALGRDSWISSADNPGALQEQVLASDLVITVGGDGTILRAMHVTAPCGVPVVGINMGRLGFMTELRAEEALERLPDYFNGSCRVEERAMLKAVVRRLEGADTFQEDGPYHAVNDVVLARGGASRVVTITTVIDGELLTTFRADGVILATATGSTGYNLAVGGPILDPASDSMVLKAVAPHVGLSTGLVLAGGYKIELALEGYQHAILGVDGYVDYPVSPGDRVLVERSELKARFLRANPPNHFYATLTRRLGFGVDRARAVRY